MGPRKGPFSCRGAVRVELIDKLFGPRRTDASQAGYFKTLTEYSPVFSTWDGGVYEQGLTRACIHAFATACSKLDPKYVGTTNSALQRAFVTWPNQMMPWSRLLYRLATIYEIDCNAAVVPSLDPLGRKVGLWPLKFDMCELVDYDGEMWARFHLPSGDVYAIEASDVCLLSKYQYESDYFGSKNVLGSTIRLLRAQGDAEENAIRIGSKIMYIGKASGQLKPKDLEAKREKFSEDNLGAANGTGLMLYDQTFDSVEPVNHKPYVISDDEMTRIDNHVFDYFGTSREILQNKFTEETWDGYYEGKVEPFAIQLSDGLNQMLFTQRERLTNHVMFSSNRLQFMSAASKRNMVRDMTQGGEMTVNEGRAILGLPPVPGGDVFMVRGEYYRVDLEGNIVSASGGDDASALGKPKPQEKPDRDPGGDDQMYQDSDQYGHGDEDE